MVCVTAMLSAQAPGAISERFGLGTFRYQGKTFTGLVLRDAYVVDLAAAAVASKQQVPGSVLAIIEQYDNGVGDRIKVVVRDVKCRPTTNRPRVHLRPESGRCPAAIRTQNGALRASNYVDHAAEMDARNANPTALDPRCRRRCLASGNEARTIRGRNRLCPWCLRRSSAVTAMRYRFRWAAVGRSTTKRRLVGVMGKPARRVPVDRLKDYIFGYTQSNDVFDWQNCALETGGGGDGCIEKGQDTFKPVGAGHRPQGRPPIPSICR